VRSLIRLAFLPGQNPRDLDRLVGGPSWINSERFTIEAVANASVPRTAITGPMFQAVLVERFGLKVRRDVPSGACILARGRPAAATLVALLEERLRSETVTATITPA
jgi:hypothetical protein